MQVRDEIDLSHKNRGPVPGCPRCEGRGSYFDPPIEQQRREKDEKKRTWIVRKPCPCIRENSRAKPQ